MPAAAPHGVDLGPLQPRIPDVLRTPRGTVELAPPVILADAERLVDAQLPAMVRGADRCTLHVCPGDATALGPADGDQARMTSRVGSVDVPVTVTDDIRAGVVSLPHGWGHARNAGAVAASRPGVNSNVLTDQRPTDPLSGNAVLNAIPVTVARVS